MNIEQAKTSPTSSRLSKRILLALFLTSLLLLALPTRSLAQAGSVDLSFDPGYIDNGVLSIAVQPNGKILIGGAFANVQEVPRNGIARLNSDGSVDPNFDPGTGAQRNVGAVVLQASGKIVFFAFGQVARLKADGTVDASFNLATASPPNITSIAVQPDDKIVIGGFFTTIDGATRNNIARLNADGSVDGSFDPGIGPDDSVTSLTLQGDGKIIIAGDFSTVDGAAHNGVARLNAGGGLDASFNSTVAGLTAAMAVQPDAKIVLVGGFSTVNGTARPFIARLNSDGSLDGAFNSGMGPDDYILALALQPDGKIVISGGFHNISGAPREHIGRLNANGTLDTSFDPGSGANAQVYSLGLQADGKILLGGFFTTVDDITRGRIARLNGGQLAPAQLLNISTRLNVLTGDNVLIGGFIVTGTEPKEVLLRGIGPSLGGAGLGDVLANPTLELHNPDGSVVTNDDWKDTQQSEISATGLAPSNDLESAIIATLDPGFYSAILSGTNGGSGVGLVEAYDLDAAAQSQLANISTRGFVQTGDNVMIGGFIVGGGGEGPTTVVVRAIGPSLGGGGVANPLQDPTLELHDGSGAVIGFDDNWKDAQETEIAASGLAPANDLESAIEATLAPGAYTAIVQGVNQTTGVGLVEAYNLQ